MARVSMQRCAAPFIHTNTRRLYAFTAGHLSVLEVLDISDNAISTLPEEIAQLARLAELHAGMLSLLRILIMIALTSAYA